MPFKGGRSNSDSLVRHESTYKASPEQDLLSANDSWFMPVVQKTGPDGCLYILDWYDRYHCYQDANRDPGGIDRLQGRLYRLRYKDTPRASGEDMAQLSDEQLTSRLTSPNGYQRDIAQRILTERLLIADGGGDRVRQLLEQAFVFSGDHPETSAFTLRSLGILMSQNELREATHLVLLQNPSPVIRAWAVRAAGEQSAISDAVRARVFELRNDSSSQVRLQVAIAAAKQNSIPTIPTLVAILAQAGDDPLVPRIVWQNLHPLLEKQTAEFAAEVHRSGESASVTNLLPRAADRILSSPKPDTASVANLVTLLLADDSTDDAADRCLQLLAARIHSDEITGDTLEDIKKRLSHSLHSARNAERSQVSWLSAVELSASLQMEEGVAIAKELAKAADEETAVRMINSLITAEDSEALPNAVRLMTSSDSSDIRRQAIQAIGRVGSTESTETLIRHLPTLPADLQPSVVESLTDRESSAIALMELVRDMQVSASLINANQAHKILSLKNQPLTDLVKKHWGIVRTERDPARLQLISRMRNELRTSQGNPVAGRVVYNKLCGQCHKLYGEGADVGPDITRNGRASFEQLLSNVFDPSLVIGAAYQGLTVVTKEGRVVSGLPVEDSPQRVVLKVQGDKQEIIARSEIDQVVPSKLSLMPEGIEKQLQPQELHDLFAFITLDKAPEDPNAKLLAGSRIIPGDSVKPDEFPVLLEQLLPGFATSKVGEGGVAVFEDYHGRPAVRTHPVSRTEACRLTSSITLPAASQVTLRLNAASHTQGDWELIVKVNGEIRHLSTVKCRDKKVDWNDITIDLTDLAGQSVTLELLNKANDWSNEFGYWNAAEILTE